MLNGNVTDGDYLAFHSLAGQGELWLWITILRLSSTWFTQKNNLWRNPCQSQWRPKCVINRIIFLTELCQNLFRPRGAKGPKWSCDDLQFDQGLILMMCMSTWHFSLHAWRQIWHISESRLADFWQFALDSHCLPFHLMLNATNVNYTCISVLEV